MNKIPSYTETTIKLFLKSIIIKKHSILKVVNKVNPIEYLCFMSKYTFQSFLTVTITSVFFFLFICFIIEHQLTLWTMVCNISTNLYVFSGGHIGCSDVWLCTGSGYT